MFGPIKGVIFDLEGTLINTYKTVLMGVEKTLEAVGESLEESEILSLNQSPMMLIRQVVPEEKWEAAFLFWQKFESNIEKNILVYPGVDEMLEYLNKKNIFIALYTSRDRLSTSSILEEKKWIPKYFSHDRLRCGDDLTGRKPSPLPIEDLCKIYNLNKKEILMIGDNKIDAEAAKAAGILFGSALWDLPGSEKQTFRSRYSQSWNKWTGVDVQLRLPSPLSLKEYFESF
jgi:phosphoglycolate phosphatase